jgi:hypothetical protein
MWSKKKFTLAKVQFTTDSTLLTQRGQILPLYMVFQIAEGIGVTYSGKRRYWPLERRWPNPPAPNFCCATYPTRQGEAFPLSAEAPAIWPPPIWGRYAPKIGGNGGIGPHFEEDGDKKRKTCQLALEAPLTRVSGFRLLYSGTPIQFSLSLASGDTA